MAVSLSSPVTGSAQTGLTTPTYTVVSDTAPDSLSKQWAVTALGGTQTGVTTHSPSNPFTFTIRRPATFRQPGVPNPSTGVIYPVGKNVWKVIVRKGTTPAANQSYQTSMCSTEIPVAAGAETYDAPNVRAMLSFFIGSLSQQSAGLGDTICTGVI